MDNAKNGQRTVSGGRRNAGITAEPRAGQIAKTDPRSRAVNRSSRADRYASFAEAVLRDLDPRGPLESLVADHVVHSAWKLRSNLEKHAARDRQDELDPDAGSPKRRIRSTELDHASRSMREALGCLDALRSRVRASADLPIVAEFDVEILPNEWPVVPGAGLEDFPEDEVGPDEEVPIWRDRLVFDFEVSDVSPVVKGTWVTVSHVVSLIVDGWNWAGILRTHPELTEDDIRTCMAYAVAEESTAP